jgi:hypothetical protein
VQRSNTKQSIEVDMQEAVNLLKILNKKNPPNGGLQTFFKA